MLHLLRRHPLPVRAFFRHCLVLTYAFPERVLVPLLPPGLTLDSYQGLGFLAIAMVQTEGLRPLGRRHQLLDARDSSDFAAARTAVTCTNVDQWVFTCPRTAELGPRVPAGQP